MVLPHVITSCKGLKEPQTATHIVTYTRRRRVIESKKQREGEEKRKEEEVPLAGPEAPQVGRPGARGGGTEKISERVGLRASAGT